MFLQTQSHKGILVITLLFICNLISFAQHKDTTLTRNTNHWGMGVKFSNPAGITLKKYFNNKAIEVIVGRPNPWKNNYYYYFRHEFKGKGYTFDGYEYDYRPISLQIHYLKHQDVFRFRGLKAYYGLGGQMRASSFYYRYYYLDNNSVKIFGKQKVHGLDFGIDGSVGLEYTFKKIPLTAFYDMTAYAEAFRHPLYIQIQSGLGVRYNF